MRKTTISLLLQIFFKVLIENRKILTKKLQIFKFFVLLSFLFYSLSRQFFTFPSFSLYSFSICYFSGKWFATNHKCRPFSPKTEKCWLISPARVFAGLELANQDRLHVLSIFLHSNIELWRLLRIERFHCFAVSPATWDHYPLKIQEKDLCLLIRTATATSSFFLHVLHPSFSYPSSQSVASSGQLSTISFCFALVRSFWPNASRTSVWGNEERAGDRYYAATPCAGTVSCSLSCRLLRLLCWATSSAFLNRN